MLKTKPQFGTVALAVFCPTSMDMDEYCKMESIILKKVDDIRVILSNGTGWRLPEKFAKDYKVKNYIIPITKEFNVFMSNREIVEGADHVLIFDNGDSKNVEQLKELCESKEKPFKVFPVNEPVKKTKKVESTLNKALMMAVENNQDELVKELKKLKETIFGNE